MEASPSVPAFPKWNTRSASPPPRRARLSGAQTGAGVRREEAVSCERRSAGWRRECVPWSDAEAVLRSATTAMIVAAHPSPGLATTPHQGRKGREGAPADSELTPKSDQVSKPKTTHTKPRHPLGSTSRELPAAHNWKLASPTEAGTRLTRPELGPK